MVLFSSMIQTGAERDFPVGFEVCLGRRRGLLQLLRAGRAG
jgi:hypothetical protein